MSLNDTPGAERLRIGFFGVRNAGKSSLVNAFTGQSLSVTSPVAGTTTDAVVKGMELLPVGPVTVVDTPGIDDEGDLGCKRADRATSLPTEGALPCKKCAEKAPYKCVADVTAPSRGLLWYSSAKRLTVTVAVSLLIGIGADAS